MTSTETARIPLDPPRTLLYRLAEWSCRRTYASSPSPHGHWKTRRWSNSP